MNEETLINDEVITPKADFLTNDESITENEGELSDAIEDRDEESVTLELELPELEEECPELLKSRKNISPERYAELRAIGLSKKEAYLATSDAIVRTDNRAHLRDSAPITAKRPSVGMTRRELENARAIFEGLDDSEILRLYRKVTK